MAESKGALIAKSMQKHAGRAKEKLLQNLGKVDRTLDDIFEEHLQNFNRQHQQATRLQKEFNNYIRCIRAVQTASKTLMEAITDVYESGWSGHDLLYVQAQNMEMLWQDFSHKLGDQVLIPLNTYTNQFPETRKKIEKRGRKLVDYDSQRHSFQNLQANSAKRRDDVKITKGREQLEEAKRTYEVLNSELHDELPALFDSRVLFFVNNLQTLFSAEQLFHSESAKVYNELEAITDKLASESQRGSYKKPIVINNITPHATPKATLAITSHNGNGTASHTSTLQTSPTTPTQNGDSPSPPITPQRAILATSCENIKEPLSDDIETKKDKPVEELYDIPPGSPTSLESPPSSPKTNGTNNTSNSNNNSDADDDLKKNDIEEDVVDNPVVKALGEKPLADKTVVDKPLDKETVAAEKQEEVYDIPVGATVAGLPPGVLYRVRATYRYAREDGDELSFDIGDVIRVVEYDDPDEQEEGWLMGIKESTNEKGMFPANFTRPI